MKIKTFIVDAFTDQPFKGNPAGICLVEEPLDIQVMQNIASELNLSETAFVQHLQNNHYSIRYFTPLTEIVFCGHATLATCKLLLTKFALLEVKLTTYHHLEISAFPNANQVCMHFPQYHLDRFTPSRQLLEAMQLPTITFAGFTPALDMALMVIDSPSLLRQITPDFLAMTSAPDKIKEVVVTTLSDDRTFDFISRCFCPWIGINEDPVTGAAHTVLANYWSNRLSKKHLKAYQASKRGGSLKIDIITNDKILVTSNAVVVFEGHLNL